MLRLWSMGGADGEIMMWNRHDTVIALREMVASTRLMAEEFASHFLHSLQIGGATNLSAAGIPPEV